MVQQPQGWESLQLPPHIGQLATMSLLGNVHTVYKPRISNPLAVLGIALGIIVADAILFAIILMLGYIVYVLVLVPIVAIIYAIYGLANCNLRVYHFEHGLIRAKGSTTNVIRWEQVAAVWQESKASRSGYLVGGALGALLFSGRTRLIYTVKMHDGQKFVFTSSAIHQIENLGQAIQQEVTQIHMPLAIDAYNAGHAIPFGPLSVSLQGISNQKGTILPWHQISGVTVNQNVVTVIQSERVKKWVSAPMSQVPNIGVLTALVNYGIQHARQ